MAFKMGISTLALGVLLLGSTARAQDTQGDDDAERQASQALNSPQEAQGFHGGGHEPYRYDDDDQYGRAPIQVHVHTSGCNHGPPPPPPHHQRGRYELQTVQRWVPDRYEQVWIPEVCHHKPHRNRVKCRGGYYDQQWVPGHYVTVQEWVWVPGRNPWGRPWGAPATHWN